MDIKFVDACVDNPQETDYQHEEIFGSEDVGTIETVVLNHTSAQNQGAQEDTWYACTIYGLTHCSNEENWLEASVFGEFVDETQGLEMTRRVIEANIGFDPKAGWSLQGALDFFKKNNMIAGYAIVKGIDGIKRALKANQMVYTGSNQIGWNETFANDCIAVKKAAYGHAFCIEGFDDGSKLLICRNSYGENAWKNGRFFVRYEDLDLLYTRYAIIDYKDADLLLLKKAKDLGVWNGERGSDIATRLEFATILSRSSGKNTKVIFSGDRPNDIPTDFERQTMTTRAFGLKGIPKTRKEVVLFSIRNKK